MNKYLILITLLILLYLYWKYQQKTQSTSTPPPDEIIERKGKDKEPFYEAEDFDLNSDDADSEEEHQTTNEPKSVEFPSAKFVPVNNPLNSEPNEDQPILSHQQKLGYLEMLKRKNSKN